jgi:hypothetical protein
LSWVAVKGAKTEAAVSALGLKRTNRREEIPESDINGVELPTGWYLVLFNRQEISDRVLQKVSRLGESVYCFVEDHVMFSCASGWENGARTWSVVHDCEKGKYHLEISGMAPSSLKEIQSRLVSELDHAGGEKADVDYLYDAPAELARHLTGFRHDQDMPGLSGDVFAVLEKSGGGSLLRRIFG